MDRVIAHINFRAKSALIAIAPATFIIFVVSVFASSAYAGLATCNPPPSPNYNLGSGSSGLVSPGGSSVGCEQVDKEFTAFNYAPGASNPVDGTNVPVTFSGTNPTGPVSVQFGSNATWEVSTNGTSTSASVSYGVAVDPSPPPAFAPPPGENYAVIALALGQQATITSGFPAATANDTITLFEYFCGGGASSCMGGGASTGFINMTAATAGFFEYTLTQTPAGTSSSAVISCFNNNGTTDCSNPANATGGSLISFASSNYSQGFQNISTFSTLSVTSGGDDTSLNFFKETYFEDLDTPEPATFGLMGVALAGLGFLHLRKRT